MVHAPFEWVSAYGSKGYSKSPQISFYSGFPLILTICKMVSWRRHIYLFFGGLLGWRQASLCFVLYSLVYIIFLRRGCIRWPLCLPQVLIYLFCYASVVLFDQRDSGTVCLFSLLGNDRWVQKGGMYIFGPHTICGVFL